VPEKGTSTREMLALDLDVGIDLHDAFPTLRMTVYF
jgi:hypothetical protein